MSVLCSSLEPRDEEQEQTHETEEYESTQAPTGWSRTHESVSPDERTTGGVLVVPGTRSMDQLHTGRTPGAHLVVGSDAWRGL